MAMLDNFLIKALELAQQLPDGGRMAIDLGEQAPPVLEALGSIATGVTSDGKAMDVSVYQTGRLIVGARSRLRDATDAERAMCGVCEVPRGRN